MNYIKLTLLFLMSSFSYLSVSAQDVDYSPYEKYDFRTSDFLVVGMTGNKLYTYLNTADGAQLEAYNDSMNKVANVLLDFFPQKVYKSEFISYPDHIIALYQSLEGTKVIQYAALLDEKGILEKNPVQIGIAKTGFFGATKTYFSTVISDDKKTIVIYNANDKGTEIELDARWLDDQLNIVKRSNVKFTADNDVQHGTQVNLANDGTLYIEAYTPVGVQSYADQFWILSLAPGATKFTSKELPLQNKFATSGYTKVDNANKRLYFGGFYSDKKNGNYDGLIFASYNTDSSIFLTKKFIPFAQDLIIAAGAHNKKHAFDNYEVKQLIAKNNGGFVLISEIHYITTRSNYTPGFGYYSWYNSPYMASMVREYHYDDIMALSYNGDGAREWSSFIPKEQYSQEDNGFFSSYALLNTGGTLAFLFNDFNSAQSRIQLATVDADGKAAVHSLSMEGSDNPDWIPRLAKQVSARTLVVPCLHKKQMCFAKIVF